MEEKPEIGLLKGLVQTVCRNADLCAAARQAAPDEDWAGLLDRLRADHGSLLRDLLGCLMLRDLPAREVRQLVMDTVPPEGEAPARPARKDFSFFRSDLEHAEQHLEDSLRCLLAGGAMRDAELELLSLHYLKMPLRLRDLASMEERPAMAFPEPSMLSERLH
ncbi:hypothetical protein [Marinimicrococcus flavescens]|uniref:Uncharacterized protein n=1 Tax=Marinimicrococcus flavescens TaxID=3031815 RepID=A0AAP3V0C7_9PROT|nr:hypothetical protein [Marinimicrococcus flavescens]